MISHTTHHQADLTSQTTPTKSTAVSSLIIFANQHCYLGSVLYPGSSSEVGCVCVCATGHVRCPARCPQGLAMGQFPPRIPCCWWEGSCLPVEGVELGDSVNPRRGTATVKLQQFCPDKTSGANHGSRPQNTSWCLFLSWNKMCYESSCPLYYMYAINHI